ncbi:MAG: polysaccharide pyruvyl transferase family protein [Planctomycetota bacterium]
MKVVIAGSFGCKNIGDDAMLVTLIEAFIREYRETLELLVLSADPEDTRRRCGLSETIETINVAGLLAAHKNDLARVNGAKHIIRRLSGSLRQKRVVQRLRDFDLFVVSGGGTINTRGKPYGTITRTHYFSSLARAAGLPLCLSGHTIGPLGLRPEDDQLARQIIESASVISVRDHGLSRRYVDMLGGYSGIWLEGIDDAYYLTSEKHPDAEASIAGVSLNRYTTRTPEQIACLASAVASLLDRFAGVDLFGHIPEDLPKAFQVKDFCKHSLRERVRVVDTAGWSPQQLHSYVSSLKFVVAARYHAAVFASALSVPYIGLTATHYSLMKKIGFMQQIGDLDHLLTPSESAQPILIDEHITRRMQSGPGVPPERVVDPYVALLKAVRSL